MAQTTNKTSARVSRLEKQERLRMAALRVVARLGVANATTRAIAEEAGLNLAAIHYAFESKDELLLWVLQHTGNLILESAVSSIDGIEDFRSAVEVLAQAVLQRIFQDPDMQMAHYELVLYSVEREPFAEVACRQYDDYVANLAAAFRPLLGKSKNARGDKQLARMVVALFDGIKLQFLVSRNQAAASDSMDDAVRIVLAAYG